MGVDVRGVSVDLRGVGSACEGSEWWMWGQGMGVNVREGSEWLNEESELWMWREKMTGWCEEREWVVNAREVSGEYESR